MWNVTWWWSGEQKNDVNQFTSKHNGEGANSHWQTLLFDFWQGIWREYADGKMPTRHVTGLVHLYSSLLSPSLPSFQSVGFSWVTTLKKRAHLFFQMFLSSGFNKLVTGKSKSCKARAPLYLPSFLFFRFIAFVSACWLDNMCSISFTLRMRSASLENNERR